jgi:transcription antitermination protein NusB
MAEGPKSNMTTRRKARKRALDVLYEADLKGEPIQTVLASTLTRIVPPPPTHLAYAVSLVEGIAAHVDRIDELISSYAEGWTLERMPVVDRNLARIGVYELLYVDDIDDAVAITEAVELAKQMSTDDSPRFLNGLLARIADYTTH